MVFLARLSGLLVMVALLAGCERQDAPPLDQQLYVWQRQWTPAHEAALKDSRADFSTLRVLALQAFPGRVGAGRESMRRCSNRMAGRLSR